MASPGTLLYKLYRLFKKNVKRVSNLKHKLKFLAFNITVLIGENVIQGYLGAIFSHRFWVIIITCKCLDDMRLKVFLRIATDLQIGGAKVS